MKRCFLYCLLSFLFLGGISGCGGDGGDDPVLPEDFTGVWEARLNFSFDGCGLAAEGVQAIVDQQEISLAQPETPAAGLSLVSGASLVNDDLGEFRSEREVLFEEQLSGDIFDIGVSCLVTAQISYQLQEEGIAALIFAQRITCDDGFACSTDAVGSARKKT